MKKICFVKMHGCGNDFMIIDLRNQAIDIPIHKVRELADYKRSVGFDQLILIYNSDIADVGIRIFNSDGSEALACGNGSRCVARIVLEELDKKNISISTIDRTLTASLFNDLISINMGNAEVIEEDISFGDVFGSLVNISNPHIVINDDSQLDILKYGPLIENDYRFPSKVNVNFSHIINRGSIDLCTWERGVGKTLSCGTGACATFFFFYKKGLVDNKAIIKQPGGTLIISMDKDEIIMSGEACVSYKGTINV